MFPSEETRLRLLQKFRFETTKNLSKLRDNLPNIYISDNQETINAMFLAAHTIKGNLGMMQLLDVHLVDLTATAGELEGIIMRLRSKETVASEALVQKIENQLDQLEDMFVLEQEVQ